MTKPLPPIPNDDELVEQMQIFAERSSSPNSVRAFQSDWSDFRAFCFRRNLSALPATAETVAKYITHLAKRTRTSTIRRRLSTIRKAHKVRGHESPTNYEFVRNVWRGIVREKGMRPRGKSPTLVQDIQHIVKAAPSRLMGDRDKALLLLGFMGSMRRSELVALDVEDLTFTSDGILVLVRRGKTDQMSRGEEKAIPFGKYQSTCAVRAIQHWMSAASISSGPLFRSVTKNDSVSQKRLGDRSVALILQRYIGKLGKDPALFAAHSLRSGFITSAHIAGASEPAIQKQSGHRSITVLRGYIREADKFRGNAAKFLDL